MSQSLEIFDFTCYILVHVWKCVWKMPNPSMYIDIVVSALPLNIFFCILFVLYTVLCCPCLCIVHSWFPLRFSLTFIVYMITFVAISYYKKFSQAVERKSFSYLEGVFIFVVFVLSYYVSLRSDHFNFPFGIL